MDLDFLDDLGVFNPDAKEGEGFLEVKHHGVSHFNDNYCNACRVPMEKVEDGLICRGCGAMQLHMTMEESDNTLHTLFVRDSEGTSCSTSGAVRRDTRRDTRRESSTRGATTVSVRQLEPLIPETATQEQRESIVNNAIAIVCAILRSSKSTLRGTSVRGLEGATFYYVMNSVGFSIRYYAIAAVMGETPQNISNGANKLVQSAYMLDPDLAKYINPVMQFRPESILPSAAEALNMNHELPVFNLARTLIRIICVSKIHKKPEFRSKSTALCYVALYVTLYSYAEKNEPLYRAACVDYRRTCRLNIDCSRTPLSVELIRDQRMVRHAMQWCHKNKLVPSYSDVNFDATADTAADTAPR